MFKFENNTYLAPGIYSLDWKEVCDDLGWNDYRRNLLDGLKRGLEALKDCGCKKAYLDGSFVSQKDRPGDFDVCYEEAGMDFAKLKRDYTVLTIFSNKRDLQKRTYRGEFFMANDEADTGIKYFDFFQLIKDPTDPLTSLKERKGIIEINLDTL